MIGLITFQLVFMNAPTIDKKSSGQSVDTEYHIEDGFIWGPESFGEYWITDDNYIFGPKNAFKYSVKDNRIYGPNCDGDFFIEDNRIFGPTKIPPWIR